jgi:hypothetical protein
MVIYHSCWIGFVLWLLIMFINGMKVDNISDNQKLKLEPFSFAFSRSFKQFVRHQDNAWRTWTYTSMEDVKQPPPSSRPIGEEDLTLI